MIDRDEFDTWSDEHKCMLRPTPCLMFKVVYEPQPHLGKNVSAGVRVLHQMFKKLNGGGEVWLPVRMED